jgi:hypothetical protein
MRHMGRNPDCFCRVFARVKRAPHLAAADGYRCLGSNLQPTGFTASMLADTT